MKNWAGELAAENNEDLSPRSDYFRRFRFAIYILPFGQHGSFLPDSCI